jgi:hypothetical protein
LSISNWLYSFSLQMKVNIWRHKKMMCTYRERFSIRLHYNSYWNSDFLLQAVWIRYSFCCHSKHWSVWVKFLKLILGWMIWLCAAWAFLILILLIKGCLRYSCIQILLINRLLSKSCCTAIASWIDLSIPIL